MKTKMKIAIMAIALTLGAAADQPPAPLTDREKAEVLDLLASKYEADAQEGEIREQLQQLAERKLGEARQRRSEATAAVEKRISDLLTHRQADANQWALDRKMEWRQKPQPAGSEPPAQPAAGAGKK